MLQICISHPDCLTLSFQGLIFVVDSNDRERIQEAAEELQKMVTITFDLNLNAFMPDCGEVVTTNNGVTNSRYRRFNLPRH